MSSELHRICVIPVCQIHMENLFEEKHEVKFQGNEI